MKKVISIIIISMILILPIANAFADNIYYWDISNLKGVVYNEESLSIEGEKEIKTSNRRGGGGTVKCESYAQKLTVKSCVVDALNGQTVYSMKFHFVNAEWEGFDSIIDQSEFDMMIEFLGCGAGWYYNSCDGTQYEHYQGSDGLTLKITSNKGYYYFTDAGEITPYLIQRLNAAKSAK